MMTDYYYYYNIIIIWIYILLKNITTYFWKH